MPITSYGDRLIDTDIDKGSDVCVNTLIHAMICPNPLPWPMHMDTATLDTAFNRTPAYKL